MVPRAYRSRRGLRAFALLAVFFTLCFSSCTHRLGWGLVLWTAPEDSLPAGSVVPVYIRSNINHVYVVGSLDGKKKFELPLWQVELYPSHGKAKAAAAKFAPVASLYLVASKDGLPVRSEATNIAPRVYRLREGQSVKILAKAKGEVMKTGDTVLEGDWYYVLTEDGTKGYAFSNTLRLFDEAKENVPAPVTASSLPSTVKVDTLFQRSWRPEYFQEMADSGRIDLDSFTARFGLFADAVHRQVRIELPAVSQVFQYSSITEDGSSFVFEGSPLRITFESEHRLLADWSGMNATAASAGADASADSSEAQPLPGANGKAEFVVLATEIRDVIRTEELRRQRLLDSFISEEGDLSLLAQVGEAGLPGASGLLAPSALAGGTAATPAAVQASEGSAAPGDASGEASSGAILPAAPLPAQPTASRLSFSGNGRFAWSHVDLVPPGYLPQGLPANATGDISFRLALPKSPSGNWLGVVSLRFDGVPGSSWVNFLYRADSGTILFAPVSEAGQLEAGQPSPLSPLRFSKSRTH